ncbi:MAG: hypothetical protein NTY19_52410 [Planctomycetota bacterium]|nr:hypothetical protein [Planctomycetota bacterium]
MRANAWRDYLEEQRDRHGKVLFTVTELAHVAGVSHAALNVELARLRRQSVIVKYAHGLYGPARAVTPQLLVPAIDSHAYITGHYALFAHHLVTQIPTVVTCFTDRRSSRARDRDTPIGRFVFVVVSGGVYAAPADGPIADPIQALCDYVYLARRQGVPPEALVTLRNLPARASLDAMLLARYPRTVQKHVARLLV